MGKPFFEFPRERQGLLLFSCSVMSDSLQRRVPGFHVLHNLSELAQTLFH